LVCVFSVFGQVNLRRTSLFEADSTCIDFISGTDVILTGIFLEAVPEPGMIAMLLVGVGTILLVRRSVFRACYFRGVRL